MVPTAMTRPPEVRVWFTNRAVAAGKLADMVVLSQDILTVPDDEIRNTEIRYTIIGGEVKYENP